VKTQGTAENKGVFCRRRCARGPRAIVLRNDGAVRKLQRRRLALVSGREQLRRGDGELQRWRWIRLLPSSDDQRVADGLERQRAGPGIAAVWHCHAGCRRERRERHTHGRNALVTDGQLRCEIRLFEHLYTKHDRFTKTGSGQTCENSKRRLVSQGTGPTQRCQTRLAHSCTIWVILGAEMPFLRHRYTEYDLFAKTGSCQTQ
jgi:hypothetical protein